MTYEFSDDIRAFLQEKTYLQNVSPETIVLYQTSFKAFYGAMEPNQLKQRVVELRQRGLKPVSVNTYLRHMKTFYLWKGLKWELPWLREEEKLLATLTSEQISRLLSFKQARNKGLDSVSGRGVNILRAWLVALAILDTGLRASEVLGLTKDNVDLHNLVFKIRGKGGKERLVPFSSELRKMLFRAIFQIKSSRIPTMSVGSLLFGTKNNTKVSVRNLERDFQVLREKLGISGIRFSPHTLRHTFACSFLRNGGDLFRLSKILGHSSISTTAIYLRSLGIEDLSAAHRQFSPLSVLRGTSQ